MGFLERTGVTSDAFDVLIAEGIGDEELVDYFESHVSDEQREAANRYVLEEQRVHLDDQDAEEGRR